MLHKNLRKGIQTQMNKPQLYCDCFSFSSWKFILRKNTKKRIISNFFKNCILLLF